MNKIELEILHAMFDGFLSTLDTTKAADKIVADATKSLKARIESNERRIVALEKSDGSK